MFTLRDPLHRLEPEDFSTFDEVVRRVRDEPWRSIAWRIYDSAGRLVMATSNLV